MTRASMVALLAITLASAATGTGAEEPAGQDLDLCLACHGERDLSLTLPSGESTSLFVDREAFTRSIHGQILSCSDCHAALSEVPHPERSVETLAEFRAGFREACKNCHFDKYALSLDGVHYQLLAKGNESAPWCTDCHGSHDVTSAGEPRPRISETCSGCHFDIYDAYAKSVHGTALVEAGNEDVPVCTDCHRSHDIADPRSESWLVRTPELCGKCHADKERMEKYGLSTAVVKTYLSDFHGMTATLTAASGRDRTDAPHVTALCIDCHGVHDIAKADDTSSPVLRANLVATCRKCHPDASESFPSAWLSHYEPSWEKAPLVYAVGLFYRIFIPFIIGGLCLQILLHLWRVVVNR